MKQQLRVVGFGLDEYDRYGRKQTALVTIKSANCTSPDDPADFDCIAQYEMVAAGPMLRDTCKGDSGGPALLGEGAARSLAAITSRPIAGIDQCGRGGIYVRMDKYEDWIRRIPEIEWP